MSDILNIEKLVQSAGFSEKDKEILRKSKVIYVQAVLQNGEESMLTVDTMCGTAQNMEVVAMILARTARQTLNAVTKMANQLKSSGSEEIAIDFMRCFAAAMDQETDEGFERVVISGLEKKDSSPEAKPRQKL